MVHHPTLHGRRHGRRLRPSRQRRLTTLLPQLRIDPGSIPEGDPRRLFDPAPVHVWLEIGFGAGEHLAALAAAHANVGFLGCEPFVAGVASLLARIEDLGLTNVRILDNDARLLLPALADRSVRRIDVPFPDPWPKARHHNRRLIAQDTLTSLARVLEDHGEFRFTSDHAGYVRWTLEHVGRHPDFSWAAIRPQDWRVRSDDDVETRYGEKAHAQGRARTYLLFRRRPRP